MWSTFKQPVATWVIELPAATERRAFVEPVLAAGRRSSVYALGDASGPLEDGAERWLSEPGSRWFPSGGPLGLPADRLRAWSLLHLGGGGSRWAADLGDDRRPHVPPLELGDPIGGELSLSIRTDAWFPEVLDDEDQWVPRPGDDAARFDAFLADVRAVAEALGGRVWLDAEAGNRVYAARVSERGLRER